DDEVRGVAALAERRGYVGYDVLWREAPSGGECVERSRLPPGQRNRCGHSIGAGFQLALQLDRTVRTGHVYEPHGFVGESLERDPTAARRRHSQRRPIERIAMWVGEADRVDNADVLVAGPRDESHPVHPLAPGRGPDAEGLDDVRLVREAHRTDDRAV